MAEKVGFIPCFCEAIFSRYTNLVHEQAVMDDAHPMVREVCIRVAQARMYVIRHILTTSS